MECIGFIAQKNFQSISWRMRWDGCKECSWRGISRMSSLWAEVWSRSWSQEKTAGQHQSTVVLPSDLHICILAAQVFPGLLWKHHRDLCVASHMNSSRVNIAFFHASGLKLIIGWLSCVTYDKMWILVSKRMLDST